MKHELLGRLKMTLAVLSCVSILGACGGNSDDVSLDSPQASAKQDVAGVGHLAAEGPDAMSAQTLRASALKIASGTTYVSDLAPNWFTNGWGGWEQDRSVGENASGDGRVLSIGGVQFAKGLGVHAYSQLDYKLEGNDCTVLTASIGVDDETGGKGSVVFRIEGDMKDGSKNKMLYQSRVLRGGEAALPISVDLTGVRYLRLQVRDGGDGASFDHADWADAKFVCNSGTTPISTPSPSTNVETQAVVYEGMSDDIANPERGFFEQRYGLLPDNPSWEVNFNVEAMRNDRVQRNLTMTRLIYSLQNYRSQNLDNAFLKKLDSDFDKARQAGVKVVLRFAYNYSEAADAPLAQILKHLDQLAPRFQANADVIAFLEAGFVGHWGEWHDSSNGLIEQGSWALNDSSRKILDKLLGALPKDRMIAIRYPRQKQQYVGSASIAANQAFNESNRARIGHYDDCFQAGPTNWGTYDGGNIESFKTYLSQDNLYTPQGGETCNNSYNSNSYLNAEPFVKCSNATTDLARLRYSTLNTGYNADVISRWKKEGCYDEIKKKLGYRYRLTSASLPVEVKPGNTFTLSFKVKNDGYGGLYNWRPLQIVLRNTINQKLYRANADSDARFWQPGGDEYTVDFSAGLPGDIPDGNYEVLLNLPDAYGKIASNPAYSVRFANKDVWESNTGFNKLLKNVRISSTAPGSQYAGSNFFK